jgi:hypothetical protein
MPEMMALPVNRLESAAMAVALEPEAVAKAMAQRHAVVAAENPEVTTEGPAAMTPDRMAGPAMFSRRRALAMAGADPGQRRQSEVD